MEFAADAVGRTVKAGPVEATALGNILVQMIAASDLSSLEQGRSLVARSFPIATYMPQESAVWMRAYERFCDLEKNSAAT